jgi:hypothetical protein
LHGIVRDRDAKHAPDSADGIRRITLRYEDGRVIHFIPDAGRTLYSEDDILELKKVLDRASSVAEWSEVTARSNVGG